jgi:hypothetical protein
VKFVNKVVDKTGAYKADLIVNGVKIPGKTFFPVTWSRKQVMDAIVEAYDNFKATGAKGLKSPDGKWVIQGITKEGIKIEMCITENALVKTAYPILR